MKQIPLYSENPNAPKFALVDDEDYEYLNQYEWRAKSHTKSKVYYAVVKPMIMHRMLLNSKFEVDHIDGDGLNNQKYNLREATKIQNAQNRPIYKNNTSGFKGVSLRKNLKKRPWQASIVANQKTIWLGYFATAEEAGRAYDQAAKLYFGEFANLNFKEP